MSTVFTHEEAAQLIENERRLITQMLASPEGRCAVGVLSGSSWDGYRVVSGFNAYPSYPNLVDVNNDFVGTPEARCAHVAAYIRSQPPVDYPIR